MVRPGVRSLALLVALSLALTAAVGTVAADAPADPDEDTIGWEDGYWYNESVSVTRADGLNETELDAVVSRSMARVEVVRQLEFEERVPVEVISREAYREQLGSRIANTSEEQAMFDKVLFEAMLTLGEDESALAAQESTLGSSVLGQYDPETETIQIVSENASTPKMDEITLSQELFHALQDQHFDTGGQGRNTTDGYLGNLGIVEGDGNLVDTRYQDRCSAEWNCLPPSGSGGGGGGGDDIHYGYYLTLLQPYSDGPPFVQGIVEQEGWNGVNEVYDRRPKSTEQVIHPEKYPSEPPVTVSVPDRSSEEWRILDVPNASVNYDTVGEAGMAVMQLYPFWHSNRNVRIQRVESFLDTGSSLDLYNYTFVESEGWGGDRIYPYVRDGSFESNETGYVWRTVWDSGEDADEFLRGYYALLEYYGASPVEGRLGTFRIPSANDLNDAFYVNHTGQTVTIVNAPTVAALANVRAGAAPSGEMDLSETPWASDPGEATPTTPPEQDPTATPTTTESDGPTPTDTAGPTTTTTTAADGPGFGALVGLVSLVVVALFGEFRRD